MVSLPAILCTFVWDRSAILALRANLSPLGNSSLQGNPSPLGNPSLQGNLSPLTHSLGLWTSRNIESIAETYTPTHLSYQVRHRSLTQCPEPPWQGSTGYRGMPTTALGI